MGKGIVVSLRSKGLPSFNSSLIFDVRYQAVQLATEVLDIFLAWVVTLACLSWSSWISISISIVSIAAFGEQDKVPMDLMFVFFIFLMLPVFILLTFVFTRRDAALRAVGDLKASVVAALLHRPPGATHAQREASEALHCRAVAFMEDVHAYLQHRRPYARHFFLPFRSQEPRANDELLRVSRELGLLLRRVHRGVRGMHVAVAALREAGVAEAQVSLLVTHVAALHAATERLSAIKEMRTPMVIRAMLRWWLLVLMPASVGPFWNYVGAAMTNVALASILGVLSNVALMAVVDTVVAMEDPFDDTALDGISLYEVLDQLGVMTTPATDADGYEVFEPGAPGGGGGGGLNGSPGGGGGEGGGVAAPPHVAMRVSGDGGGGGGGGVTVAAAAAAAESTQAASPGARQPALQGGGGGGYGTFRSSAVTSETAVGPPSAIGGGGGDPYGNGGAGVPSITSPPLPELAAPPVRQPVAMPPMPAIVGQHHSYKRLGGSHPHGGG